MRLLMIPLFLIAEIALSISIADEIGALATVVWLIVAVVAGVNLLRHQGPASMLRATEEMRRGGQPALPLVAGLVSSFAAVLLIVPGFLSDLIALILLIKPLRRLLFNRFLARMAAQNASFTAGFQRPPGGNVYEHQGDPRNTYESDAAQLPRDASDSKPPQQP